MSVLLNWRVGKLLYTTEIKKPTKIELQPEERRLNEKLKNFDNEDYETLLSFSEENHDEDDPDVIPPTSQVTNAKRKLYVENKTKNSKKSKNTYKFKKK